MRPFELWWAELPPPIGRRPVLLLSRPGAHEYLSKLIVAEVTTTVRRIPQEVALGRREGLSRSSVVNLDNLHVVPTQVLSAPIGALAAKRHVEVKRALGYALGWPELKLL